MNKYCSAVHEVRPDLEETGQPREDQIRFTLSKPEGMLTFSSWGHPSALVFFPTDHSGNFYQMQKLHLTTRANSIAFYHSGIIDETTDGSRVFGRSPQSMDGAAGAPPQLTDGACEAAQSTGAAALRCILRARPLALRLH